MRKFLIKVNGNQYEVEVEEVGVGGGTEQPAKTTPAGPAAPAASAPAQASAAPAGANVVKAPMPGSILKVNVSAGDTVKKGQVLLILEAMKMENEIVSPADGKVASVNVQKGSSVNAGDVMVTLA